MLKATKFLFHALLGALSFMALSASTAVSQETPTPTVTPQRVWTVSEILRERSPRPIGKRRIRYCQGHRFKPCVCWQDVAREMKYRPAVAECGGNAAVILRGKYLNIFSVVVRDDSNRDRWPASGFNGCTPEVAQSISPPASCSAFKVQERFRIEDRGRGAEVHCLGAPGYSDLFKRVVRVTGKLGDDPKGTNDPIVRWCLRSPTKPLN